MISNPTFLAIIPARGGSKRLPRKNILPLMDKPLIAWTIEAAKKSKYINKIVVTSDDDEILNISKANGAEIIKRPDELATDTATSFDAIAHSIKSLEKYDYVVLLQPTSPLRDQEDIDDAIELLLDKSANAIISVCEVDHSPEWCNTLPENTDMSNFLPKSISNKRSQDLSTYYRINGAIYICDSNMLLDNKGFFLSENIYAYIMPRKKSIDIDEQIDFEFAKVLIESKL
ncbi:acylneuraminate cytidylyltransferase family protein [Francisella philomiragia]|uniref:Acylneuraminate cytidylyltransferase n=1 Tax=Francisella philomiragia subsp. philomiragia (strain ATCC 25017 / CCUG 19701 / FSC 153 / O\|nr:acylneuraminate cytidylyltransferase family protein [Francisella philomiragia]AJI46690.1 cytidylyltransferase family protein [Francisella philomiragia]AJI48989.1 cytidylyltransferase family protein [Francisella philomiragia]MBK2019704.1 acylneuraminate cytidylyltransferase family protein [Francisella philomiragia]MBK2029509.1 acylneuraminate cytidylyltransferase family protein [Francisella philomiragia]MBK2264035.1 acylneuraminate cytidylyltransferase family protein [Francisella philomiragi